MLKAGDNNVKINTWYHAAAVGIITINTYQVPYMLRLIIQQSGEGGEELPPRDHPGFSIHTRSIEYNTEKSSAFEPRAMSVQPPKPIKPAAAQVI